MPKRKQQPKHDKKPKSKLTKKTFVEDDDIEIPEDIAYDPEEAARQEYDEELAKEGDEWNGDWSDAEDDYEDPK